MRLTKQTNYAIRILIYCAANEGKLSRVPEIAKAYSVSELFLFKILQPLVAKNLIATVRGRHGGIKLAKPAYQISVAEVVRLMEENFSLAECFDNDASECPLIQSCGLNATLSKALNAFFAVLSATSIADLQRPNFRKQLGLENQGRVIANLT